MTSIKFVNLTSVTVDVVRKDGSIRSFAPSGQVATVSSTRTVLGEDDGMELARVVAGSVVGLPAPEAGVVYIVSGLLRAAVPTRHDVCSPGDLVRGEGGKPIGCKGLVFN